jgi:hypothetical protein
MPHIPPQVNVIVPTHGETGRRASADAGLLRLLGGPLMAWRTLVGSAERPATLRGLR